MGAEKHAGGRPPKFKTVEELDAKIDEYFESGFRTVTVGVDKQGEPIVIDDITLTDLVLFLGFCDKQSLYDYQKKPEFSCSIKRARTFIEREYESGLKSNHATGSIFALKNMGWADKQEIDHSSADGTMSPKDPVKGLQDMYSVISESDGGKA